MTSSKERALDLSESTIEAEKGKVIVRSSYFMKNKKKEDNQDDKSEINGAANDRSHRSIQENDCDSMSDARDETVAAVVKTAIVRSSYFQHKPSAGNGWYINSFNLFIKDDAPDDTINSFLVPLGDTEQSKENKRVIVRSSYFQHKRSAGTKENENCQDNSHVAAELQHTSPKASSENDCCEVRLKKRKVTFIDTAQTVSCFSIDVSLPFIFTSF